MVTIYERPNCISCEQTKRYLDLHGIDYQIKTLTEEAAREAADSGWSSAPLVYANGTMWGGFSIERMKQHILEA
jgi:glutaredoxin-like protein NrdH